MTQSPTALGRRGVLLAGVGAGLAACLGRAAAQTSSAPIVITIGTPPGGAVDLTARLVGEPLSSTLGQVVTYDYRPGANHNIAAAQVARAKPDGHTLLAGTVGTHGINPSLYRNLLFKPVEDFAPVAWILSSPACIAVPTNSPIRNVADLKAAVENARGDFNWANPGIGSSGHMSGELFRLKSGLKMNSVPYRGSGPALTDLMGGHVPVLFDNLISTVRQHRAGQLRVIAVTTAERAPLLPDVPTVAEQGLPDFEATSWIGFFAPAGTPEPVLERLNAGINAALKRPEVGERIRENAGKPEGGSRERLGAHVKAELAKWAEVVRASGVSAE